ncbi:MAG: response regulator [Treponema sp.]|nr:response regulator [Treponema sp.]
MENSNFIANTVHEIRTPVQTIIGTLELLSDTKLNTEQTEYVRQIKFGADVLLTLVNDILDFSKIHSNNFSLENIPYDVVSLTEQTAYLESIEAFNKNIELVTDIDYSIPPLVMGDPTRVKQILLNIIKNAIKFTSDGYIHVELSSKHKNKLLFQITDTGIGIPTDKIDKIFSSYYQADTSTSRKYGGTGLGLAICKALIAAMNGEIGVKPNPYGGSIFWFTIPLVPAENPEVKEFELPVPATTHILIVEDSMLSIRSLQNKLNTLGLQYIDFVTNSHEAILSMQYAAKLGNPFDIVFIDMKMPIIDGWHLASEIKNDKLISKAKLYMLVPEGQMGKESKMKLLNWFTGYLYKPVKLEKLDQLLLETNGTMPSTSLLEILQETTPTTTEQSATSKIASGIKILVAEDHPVNRRLLVTFLKQYGATVFEAENGQIALDCINANKDIKIIFMDIQMPIMSGIEATIELKKQNYTGIIIACTANNNSKAFNEYTKIGINDILVKPFKRDNVKSMIDKWKSVINLPESIEVEIANLDTKLIKIQTSIWDSQDFEDTIGHDKDLGTQILFDYILQTRQLIQKSETFIKNQDFTELRRLGHTLKGSSAAISANTLASIAEKINLLAKQQNTPEIQKYINKFSEEFDIFIQATDKWKKGLIDD